MPIKPLRRPLRTDRADGALHGPAGEPLQRRDGSGPHVPRRCVSVGLGRPALRLRLQPDARAAARRAGRRARSGTSTTSRRSTARPIATGPHCFGCTAGRGLELRRRARLTAALGPSSCRCSTRRCASGSAWRELRRAAGDRRGRRRRRRQPRRHRGASRARVPGVRVLAAARGRGPADERRRARGAGRRAALPARRRRRCRPTRRELGGARAGGSRRRRRRVPHPHAVADDGRNWLGPLLRLADLRSRVTRLPYGDQAVFVRRERVRARRRLPRSAADGGHRAGATAVADRTHPHRPRRGARLGAPLPRQPVRAVLAMRLFPLLYRLGVSPALLARLYGQPR